MHKRIFYGIAVLYGVLFCTSCQKDSFTDPDITPKEYVFQIPGKLSFNFSQIAPISEEAVPFQNSLSVKNLGDSTGVGSYTILAFEDANFRFDKLLFQNNGTIPELVAGDSTSVVVLPETRLLFSETNTLVSVLNFNGNSHALSGRYQGEINQYREESDSSLVFERSFIASGLVDYQGRIHLFTQDSEEENIVYIRGNFNEANKITADILTANTMVYASLENEGVGFSEVEEENKILRRYPYQLDGDPKRILELKLTKQN